MQPYFPARPKPDTSAPAATTAEAAVSRPAPASPQTGTATGPAIARPPSGGDEVLSRRTELVLRELGDLPTLPAVASRVLQLASSDDVPVKEVVRVIESDPALTMRLLALCKRAAYRTRHPITTVEMAVVMLGMDAVRSLVLSVAIFDWTNTAGDSYRRTGAVGGSTGKGSRSTRPGMLGNIEPKAAFNRTGFWQHSIAVACCADLIAREHPEMELHPEECFVCGLVHDLGKVALDLVLPKAYARVIELAEARQGNIADFERPIVGLDHHIAGRTLAERWGLPALLCDAMSLHNLGYAQLNDGPHRRTIAVVNLADLICRKLALGWSGNFATGWEETELCEQAGLNAQRVLGLTSKLYEATSARMRDLGLGDEPSQQLLIESILRANQRLGRVNQDLIESNAKLEQAQRELAETRAMARLGQMTAGAAHEMNNPLTVISGRSQSLLGRLREDQDRITAKAIIEASTRLTTLIARLNRIASPPTAEPSVIEVRDTLEDIITRAKDNYGERVQARGEKLSVMGVKLTVADGIEIARVDKDILGEALIEVIVNALESGPRGRVEVRVDAPRSDDRLQIQVVDDGTGMSEKALLHATDPFFSEKPAGRQSGLGLALAHRLIGVLGGEIELTSKPARGTTVCIRIPDWRATGESRGKRAA